VSKGDLQKLKDVKVGDLVTYRSIQELTQENYQQKIIIHGVGVVVMLDDEYAKVYWIHAKQFLWVIANKLTTFDDISARY
jgi:hypothetical protein|tara:strand:+ start:657 stop:896 length:240 start_codon:yes stop_codon:yes gene_type:complete